MKYPSSTPTVTIYVEREDKEIEVIVEIDYSPAERGSRGKYGEQMEPDYDEECKACGAKVDGVDFEITDEEAARAEDKFMEELEEYFDEP